MYSAPQFLTTAAKYAKSLRDFVQKISFTSFYSLYMCFTAALASTCMDCGKFFFGYFTFLLIISLNDFALFSFIFGIKTIEITSLVMKVSINNA